jgi:hypothetical protein
MHGGVIFVLAYQKLTCNVQDTETHKTTETDMTNNHLNAAYEQFTIGSNGFCSHIETHCGFGISTDEIKRIAEDATTADEFVTIWESSDYWTDANN